jgi:putative ABC transport system substrate-binding protein
MRRRAFIKVVGGAAAVWPLTARSQPLAVPVIGFMSGASSETMRDYVTVFQQSLAETGFTGSNVATEYRWAEGDNDRVTGAGRGFG